MAVTTTNFIQGPATIYTGAFGVAEPVDTAVATPPSTGWTDSGGTQDGLKMTFDQKYSAMECDQIVDNPGSRLVERTTTAETNMAEATLENLKVALNGGTITTGTGFKKYEPAYATSATQPTYSALCIDGYAPGLSFARRVIVRKVLNTDKVEYAYTKDKQSVWSVKFESHFVSTSIAPFIVVDATA